MTLSVRSVLLVILHLVFISSSAPAGTSHFAWQGVLRYDPNEVVLLQGGTLGDLMIGLGADPDSNELAISGTFSYDDTAVVGTANGVAAGYPHAIRSTTIRIGNQETSADIDKIHANAETSRVGMIAGPSGDFCGDADHCDAYGARAPGWGNQVALLNDTPHVLIDETGGTPELGDAYGFMLGRTGAMGEFSPPFRTSDGKAVFVDGLSVLMFSRPGPQMLNSLALPRAEDIAFADTVGRTEIWLFLEGEDLFRTIRIEGAVTAFFEPAHEAPQAASVGVLAWQSGYH